MTAAIDLGSLKDALIVLATAGVVVPLMHKLKISPVLGYLAAGAALGPKGLGALEERIPGLHWITIGKAEEIAGIAEFGVVFLMFVIGLELSLNRLTKMRRLVFGLGLAQVLASTVVIAAAAIAIGLHPGAALVVGSCLALSSTAIVIDMLAEQKRLTTMTGRVAFAVLLAQDLAVVPILFLVGSLGEAGQGSILLGISLALLQAVGAIAAIVLVGRRLLKPLFRMVAATDSPELFMAAILLVAVGTGAASAAAGLSMALGAFVAGILLAETEYRRAIEATIMPFKGLLLGVFFFSVGMNVDVALLVGSPLTVIGLALGLVAVKIVVFAGLARLFGITWPYAIKSAFLLGSGGEFAFIVVGMAAGLGIVKPEQSSLILGVVALTMAAIPLFDWLGRQASRQFEKIVPPDPETMVAPPQDGTAKAIIVGFGRVGELVAAMLAAHKVPYLATDRDPTSVTLGRRRGYPVYFGDVTSPDFLKHCDIDTASAVVVTVNSSNAVDAIVQAVRALRQDIVIVARARDADHARHLYELGVTDAVPETIEASLQLSEAALVGLGVAIGPVIASIHEKRDEFRRLLSQAAVGGSHASVESKTDGLRARKRRMK